MCLTACPMYVYVFKKHLTSCWFCFSIGNLMICCHMFWAFTSQLQFHVVQLRWYRRSWLYIEYFILIHNFVVTTHIIIMNWFITVIIISWLFTTIVILMCILHTWYNNFKHTWHMCIAIYITMYVHFSACMVLHNYIASYIYIFVFQSSF